MPTPLRTVVFVIEVETMSSCEDDGHGSRRPDVAWPLAMRDEDEAFGGIAEHFEAAGKDMPSGQRAKRGIDLVDARQGVGSQGSLSSSRRRSTRLFFAESILPARQHAMACGNVSKHSGSSSGVRPSKSW